jgi:hypothetical protein
MTSFTPVLERKAWASLAAEERSEFASKIAEELPLPFDFVDVHPCELGDQRCDVAVYRFAGASFVLIPGGSAELGYDLEGHPFELQPEHMEPHGGDLEALKSHIRDCTTEPRTCSIAPCLVEVEAQEVGMEPASADDPDIAEQLTRLAAKWGAAWPFDVEVFPVCRLHWRDDGSLEAFRRVETTHAQVVDALAAGGFRLPSSDEWEYFCGCGTRALFRWGNFVPCDRYPNDKRADHEILSMTARWDPAQGPYPAEPEDWEWDLHRRPNAFGLQIARNPYCTEIVAEPDHRRGGDGGGSVCGGENYFNAWLTLAPAFFCALPEGVRATGAFARRVFPLE